MSKYRIEKNDHYGFFQIKPTPTPEEITKFYSDEFYSGEYSKFNDSSLEVQLEDREFYELGWSDILHRIEAIIPKKPSDVNILDIGCGWAQALLFFKEKGYNCYGFDPSPEAVEYGVAKGLNLKCAGLDSMAVFGDTKFDVVILKNVLEHLLDPEAVLKEISDKVLVPGGLIVIDVPNEFNEFQVCGKEIHNLSEWWVAPPAHLNYFNGQTLSNLLNGLNYTVCDMESSFPLEMFLLFGDCYVGDAPLGKMCHNKRVNFELNLRKTGREDTLRKFYRALAELNLGRQVTVYATKK